MPASKDERNIEARRYATLTKKVFNNEAGRQWIAETLARIEKWDEDKYWPPAGMDHMLQFVQNKSARRAEKALIKQIITEIDSEIMPDGTRKPV